MKIVIATDSFKGTLSSLGAGEAIADGARRAVPGADTVVVPVADGGEGTVEAVLRAGGGRRVNTVVQGPLGEAVRAGFAILDQPKRAVIEMASASGLTLLESDRCDPLKASTFGTGQLIAAALDQGCRDLLVAVGGSATVDGGCGAAQALGVRFRAANGSVVEAGIGGGQLDRIRGIDLADRDPRVAKSTITVLCDVHNPLYGATGAARVFGPQKGADPQQVEQLERNLVHLAEVIRRELGVEVCDLPGAGAAGGLAAGLVAFAGARLVPGVEAVLDIVGLDEHLAGADLVVTGEGRLDEQSMMGKVVSGVAARARQAGAQVIAIAGVVEGDEHTFGALLDGWYAVADPPPPVPPAADQAARALTHRAAEVIGRPRS